MSQNYAEKAQLIEALQWHLDNGADELLLDTATDRTVMPELPKISAVASSKSLKSLNPVSSAPSGGQGAGFQRVGLQDSATTQEMMGAAEAVVEAQKLAAASQTLEELREAITNFEGLSVRKTATNMVFSDGNPKAATMVIGEAPGADEDIAGKPFAGENGQLLDRILACIALDRTADEPEKAVYLSNVLNWRPPGNRTPTQSEMDISLPFIERHIALIQPKAIILCGGVSAKSLLRRSESISKLRGAFYDYQVPEALQTPKSKPIPVIATYHPAYLLKTPAQKKAVWADMLMFQEKLSEILG